MAKVPQWQDEYWLLLIRLFMEKPQGIKHLFSRQLVDVAMELHIPPRQIHRRMYELRRIATPRMQKLWDEYADSPKKLERTIKRLRNMQGFGNAKAFYAGVVEDVTWEKDFMPLPGLDDRNENSTVTTRKRKAEEPLTPAKLIMILDLYFRLTPITMVAETPEVEELARDIHCTPQQVADVMGEFLKCDPYIAKEKPDGSPLFMPCMDVWKRFGNDDPERLAALAAQLKEYWK